MDRIELLRKVPLFSALTEEYLKYLSDSTCEKDYEKDEIILQRGEKSGFLGILISGKLKVTMLSSKGGEMSLDILNPCSFIGEISLLDDNPHSATVIALKKSSLLILSREGFEKLLNEIPEMSLFLLKQHVKIIRRLNNKIADISFMDISQRVAKKLVDFHNAESGRTIEITHQELANLTGCNRETATRVLNEFERKDYVYMKKGKIKVKNPEKLKDIYRDYWVDRI